jgi:hypothetical protein
MTDIQMDTYAWRFVWGSTGLAAVLAAQTTVLAFFPSRPPWTSIAFAMRFALDLALPLVFLCICGFAIWLAVAAVLALLKRRLRRALSFVLALVAIPLVFVVQAELVMFDPYYWYVLANEARFEAEAKAISKANAPAFAVVETRDVSIGMVTTPPRFRSIIYDESDEVGLDPEGRSVDWRERNLAQLQSAAANYAEPWYWVRRLAGHFYLVEAGG